MNFNLGALSEWEGIEPGEVVRLDVGSAAFRRVDLELIADAPVCAYVGDKPVGVGEGYLSISFTAEGDVPFVVLAHADAKIILRTKARSQTMPESDEASYTTVEPRPAGPSDEVRRMMRMMHLNHERRMAELRAEIAAMQPAQAKAHVAEVIEKDDPPAEAKPEAKA